MKRIIAIFAIVSVSIFGFDIEPKTEVPVNFAGIQWGSTLTTTSNTLHGKGYTYMKKETEGKFTMYTFKGMLFGETTHVEALFAMGKLIKITVNLITDDNVALSRFLEVKKALDEKYGEGYTVVKFQYPYELGDGYEQTAVKTGKAVIANMWQNPDSTALTVKVSEKLTVVIYYESSAFYQILNQKEQVDKGNL